MFRINESTLVFLVIVLSAIAIAYIGLVSSPTIDEVGHLPAGCLIVEYGVFDLYEVNPPIAKVLSAIPVTIIRPNYDWSSYSNQPGARREWEVVRVFCAANGEKTFEIFAIARWSLLPLWILGAVIVARWASHYFGQLAGLTATILWSTTPDVMAWSATICPDSIAATMGLISWCWFRKWICKTDSLNTLFCGFF